MMLPSPGRVSTLNSVLIVLKTLFAFLGFSALVTEMATLVAKGRWNAGDFFSYFTVEANTLAAISLVLGGYALATGRKSRGLDLYRGAVAMYMTTVILIFIFLLSGYPSEDLTAVPWDNTVLHYIMPIVVILDWLVIGPAAAVSFRQALVWLAVPLAYLFYSLIRGAIVDWYPYPFMDPSTHGYLGIVITSVILAVILAIVTVVVAAAPGWLAKLGVRQASARR